MRRSTPMMTALVLVIAVAAGLPACAQPLGPGGGPGMRPTGMAGPTVTMTVSDGIVYVACDGKLTAYEARTLKQLAQVTFWTAPTPPVGGMGPGGQQPVGPPPAAP